MTRSDEELKARRDELEKRGTVQCAQLAEYGVDPERRRVMDLTFWAPDEATAARLSEAMVRNEMTSPLNLGPASGSSDERWLVRAQLHASPAFMTVRENLVTLILFADKYDCDFDGWGTAVVEVAERAKDVPPN